MAADKRVGYAVIGLGKWAQNAILPGFSHAKKAKLVALVSGDREKGMRLKAKFGAEIVYTYSELPACLSDPRVEAVYIATTIGTHALYTIQAANAGKHVLCEKTMASSVVECRRMVETCRAADCRLMIGYRKYFDPSTLEVKKLIANGKLGRLKYIHTAIGMNAANYKGPDAWILDTKDGGGVLPEVGVYCVNTLRWLVDKEPLETAAYGWTTHRNIFSKVDENISFRLNFPDGLVALATASFGVASSSFLQIHGENGWVTLSPAYQLTQERRMLAKIGNRKYDKRFKVTDELALELDAFATAIRRKHEPEPNGVVGMRDVAIMEAIFQSAREGRTVSIRIPD